MIDCHSAIAGVEVVQGGTRPLRRQRLPSAGAGGLEFPIRPGSGPILKGNPW